MAQNERATRPEDLTRLFLERANVGDADGAAELYAADAVYALPDGSVVTGREALRKHFSRLFAPQLTYGGEQSPVVSDGELAITSTRISESEMTVRIARREPDGSWLWVIDQPNILSKPSPQSPEPVATGQHNGQERAVQPEDLARLFFMRANAGDIDGLIPLFEPAAVSVLPDGEIATGQSAIGESFEELVAAGVAFTPVPDRPALRAGDLALTSRWLTNGEIPVEVARRQPQGDWLWVVDQPNILR